MDYKLARLYLIELLGVYAVVYFSAGAVCVNQLTTPTSQPPPPLTFHQPGLFGIAVAHGLIFGLMLALTAPVTGGYLNPAVTLLMWVSNRLDTRRACWLLGAQVVGAVLAGLSLRLTFSDEVMATARYGAPHLNLLAYPAWDRATQIAGISVEVVLTFFLVFAIFGLTSGQSRPSMAGLAAGAGVTAGVLVAFPLTGAAMNPARWFGPVFWEYVDWARQPGSMGRNPWTDAMVFLAGPILGALLGGLFCFRVYLPAVKDKRD